MKKPTERLSLKWGTLKGCSLRHPASMAALKKYDDAGRIMASAIMQDDTAGQKKALCELIDAVDGPIYNDWQDKYFPTKEAAKCYVMEYKQ